MNVFFKNFKRDLVDEAIDGALRSSPFDNLARLNTHLDMRIVVRSDWDKESVALISGGGAGHEPAEVGFVGKGMLTAAVCGEIFTSPTVEAVLTAIIHVTGEAGCLLIVKNHTGDRLNFGLAAEKARGLGYRVEMVIVKDDIAMPDNPQPRGTAGAALVIKVAGYVAQYGGTLEAVMEQAQTSASQVVSMGVSVSNCPLAGEGGVHGIKPDLCEVGVGIEGAPGVQTLATKNSQELVKLLTEKLMRSFNKHHSVALMVNNLGGISPLELTVLTGDVMRSPLAEYVKLLVGPAAVVSALDTKGFSLSLLPLTGQTAEALLSPVEASGWPVVMKPRQPASVKGMPLLKQVITPSENGAAASVIECVCETLINKTQMLNALDALVGDGDTGTAFSAGARNILSALLNNQLPLNQPELLMGAIGERLATAMSGTSGVLMSILFTTAGQKISGGASLSQALLYGLERMQFYGGAGVGDRTMIDALKPAFRTLAGGEGWDSVAFAASKGAGRTSDMAQARAGRSSYLQDQSLKGVKDPGACAVEQVFLELARHFR